MPKSINTGLKGERMKKHAKKLNINISQTFKKLLTTLQLILKQTLSKPKSRLSQKNAAPIEMKRTGRKRVIRIKNTKRLSIIAGGIVVAVIALVLVTSIGGPKAVSAEEVAVADDDLLLLAADSEPMATTIPEAKITLAMPVFEPISISQGTEATVVSDLQTRLMELDYLDEDEPGTVYEETTKLAVEHFQAQHGLPVTGTVDEETYDLLMSDEAQYYTITIEAEGTDVSELQQRLYELDYIDKVTGYFGTDTEEAVEKFQKLNGLTEDGKVGKNTREMLYSTDATPNMYSYGEESDEILTYQERLQTLGYLTTEPDGTFGDDTKAAVKRFQESNGLLADGYIGPSTKAALMSDDAQSNALSVGISGDDVTSVQERLKALGYMSKATGYYGEGTESAVRSFQQTNGLTVDGKVGKNTMNALFSSSAKKKPASSSGSSSSSSSGSSSSSSSGSSANITGANIESFISVAESKLGCKYVRGGKGPNTFDCSGFVYWCLNQVGVNQSYMTSSTWASSTKYTKITSMSDMQRGDIIVFSGHVAIYAGDGIMIDASSNNGKVVKRSCTGSWSQRNFKCAFRVF